MKRILLTILLLAPLCSKAEKPPDNRPLTFPKSLSEETFRSHGLWFWAEEEKDRTTSSVEFVYGDDNTSPTRRSLTCVGRVGTKVAIYCVNSGNEGAVTLMLSAFLAGYIAPIGKKDGPDTYDNAVQEPQAAQQPKPELTPEPTPRLGRAYGKKDPFGRAMPTSSGKFFLPQIDYDFAEVTLLVEAYMQATQHGEPISLSPYCTKQLLEWYGKKQISIRQAETEVASYFNEWPTQTRSSDVNGQMTFEPAPDWPGLVAYRVTLPFTWSASSATESKNGRSVMTAIVVRSRLADESLGEMLM